MAYLLCHFNNILIKLGPVRPRRVHVLLICHVFPEYLCFLNITTLFGIWLGVGVLFRVDDFNSRCGGAKECIDKMKCSAIGVIVRLFPFTLAIRGREESTNVSVSRGET